MTIGKQVIYEVLTIISKISKKALDIVNRDSHGSPSDPYRTPYATDLVPLFEKAISNPLSLVNGVFS